MRYLLLFTGLFITHAAFAQLDEVYNYQTQFKKKQPANTKPLPNYRGSVPGKNERSAYSSLPNGNSLSLLAQDKMLYIKPDVSQFNMPVKIPENLHYICRF